MGVKIASEYQRLAQELLNEAGANLKEDGDFARFSDEAADRIHGRDVSPERNVAGTVQKAYNAHSARIGRDAIKVDFFWGPDTLEAADQLIASRSRTKLPQRPDEKKAAQVPAGQCHDGTCSLVKCWSPTDAQMEAYYGPVGSNQVVIPVPFDLVLDWDPDTTIKKFSVHRKVSESVKAALSDILAHYGADGVKQLGLDRFGGALNVRKKRGGSTWSAHAWGTALDFWPEVNALRENHTTARFARAEYAPWFRIWEANGFMSLGRCFDFDWMHVQKNPPR